jgi:hypothetical protein
LDRAANRREIHFPLDEKQYEGQKQAYDLNKADWDAQKANMEFEHDKQLYNMALKAINNKNCESRSKVIVYNLDLFNTVNHSTRMEGSNGNRNSKKRRINKRAGKRYDDKHSKRIEPFDPLSMPMNDLDDKVKQVTKRAEV